MAKVAAEETPHTPPQAEVLVAAMLWSFRVAWEVRVAEAAKRWPRHQAEVLGVAKVAAEETPHTPHQVGARVAAKCGGSSRRRGRRRRRWRWRCGCSSARRWRRRWGSVDSSGRSRWRLHARRRRRWRRARRCRWRRARRRQRRAGRCRWWWLHRRLRGLLARAADNRERAVRALGVAQTETVGAHSLRCDCAVCAKDGICETTR